MGAPQALSELPLQDQELSEVAFGIGPGFLNPFAVEYLKIPQVEADVIFSDCRQKVTRTAVQYLHHWKNRQCLRQQRRRLIEILHKVRERGWISITYFDFLYTPTEPPDTPECNCTGGTYYWHFHSGASGAGNVGSVRDEPDFGPNNLPHVSSFRPYQSQGEQINLGDQENSVDSTGSEFNNNENRHSNHNIINSKQPLISTIHPDPGPATSSSETSFFTCEHATGNSDCDDDINQTIPMEVDCFPSRCHKHRNSGEIGGNCVGHLDPVSAISSSETSFLTRGHEAGNSECEDDTDETNPMRCGRFPDNPCHEHSTSREIGGNYVGHCQILAHHVPERDNMEMSCLLEHCIPPSDLHETDQGAQDFPTPTGYDSVGTKHVPYKFPHDSSVSAPSTPKGQCRQKQNTKHKHSHSDGHMLASKDFVNFQQGPLRSISHPSNSKPKTKVFITYAKDDKKHLALVLEMAHFLKKHDIAVAIDVKELRDLAIDKMGWLDSHFHNVDKVIVAISPEYFRIIGGNSGSRRNTRPELQAEDIFSEQGLNTLYIYKKMQIEYRNRGCQNQRFMPVIFRQSKATMEHVPTWLQNTLVYTWPEHKKNIEMHAKGCYYYD